MKALSLAAATIALLSACSSQSEPAALNLEGLLDQTSEFQREIIEDGEVSSTEYERAVMAQRDCVIAAGAKPSEVRTVGNNELTFDYDVTAATEDDVEQINAKAEACLPEFLSEVGQLWAYQELLSPEEREDQRGDVIDCLTTAGVELPEDATSTEIFDTLSQLEDLEEAMVCVDEYPGFFSVPATSEDRHEH
ncbi:hypothetical protein [Agromyces sp. NPDC058126]|uniref:hypothetical protein n=1 Tax=Agromyces sp. NPDC058126 TaxID=3346350 RepID=UPI0036DDE893